MNQILNNEIGVFVVDFPQTAILLPDKRTGTASVLFTHNVEAEILERHSKLTSGLRQKIWLDQTHKMRNFEAEVLRKFDSVIAVSERDAESLRLRYDIAEVATIDTGVDLDSLRFSPPYAEQNIPASGGEIVFTGVMDSPANIDGVTFLVDQVWPIVIRGRPQARAVIVGRNPPKALTERIRELGYNWEFTGFVEDVRPFIVASQISVIPLRVGSGTRLKAFEAMALGRPVVSTPVGIEGLAVEDGRHYLSAEAPEDFANAILRLLDSPELCNAIARAARDRLEERFSWSKVARQFERICERAIAQKRNVNH